MKKGNAPHYDEVIDVPKELHHINGRNIDNPHNINNLEAVGHGSMRIEIYIDIIQDLDHKGEQIL